MSTDFLSGQIGPNYFANLPTVSLPAEFDTRKVKNCVWPEVPEGGIGKGSFSTGKEFVICKYEENGAPGPVKKVTQFIFFKRMGKPILAEVGEGVNTQPQDVEIWKSARRIDGTTKVKTIYDIRFLNEMLKGKGLHDEETKYRRFIKS